MPVARRPDVCFVRGKGSWLWDSHGKFYLDFVQGWAVNCLGHAPDIVAEALTRQAAKLIYPGPGYFNAPMIELADMIAAHSCFDQLFFTNSGAEANEGAIKLARKWGATYKQGAFEIITLQHGFHGRTLATCALRESPGGRNYMRRECRVGMISMRWKLPSTEIPLPLCWSLYRDNRACIRCRTTICADCGVWLINTECC